MDQDEAEVWEVAEIVNSRMMKALGPDRLRWEGCTEFKDRWDTIDHLYNCTDKLEDFRQRFLSKPRDQKEVSL